MEQNKITLRTTQSNSDGAPFELVKDTVRVRENILDSPIEKIKYKPRVNNNYSNKLKDPKWQKKRLEVLNRDNFSCQICNDDTTELHVHHEHYQGNPWEVTLDDLRTLCKHCHTMTHRLKVNNFIAIKTYDSIINSTLYVVISPKSCMFFKIIDDEVSEAFGGLNRENLEKIHRIYNPE